MKPVFMKPVFLKVNEGYYINLSLVTEIIENEDEGITFYFGEAASDCFPEPSFNEMIKLVNKAIEES